MSDVSKLTDSQVVEIVRTKNKELFSEIIKRYQNKLLRYAINITGSEHVGADVVQDSLIKAFVNLNGFDTKRKFSSWIYRIVHNESMNALSKNKKIVSIDEKFDFEDNQNIEDDFVKQELVNKANNCLRQMPMIYKEPLSLYYLDNKSYDEISDILRLSIGTVSTRINRAKLLMKKICQKKQ